MQPWKRRRDPDDVPTPVAVALADFCRRAKAPAPAARVREALSLLEAADDFRVKALADGEPLATPLGPFAVIDVVLGTEPEVASQREQTGYYELARQMIAEALPAGPGAFAPRGDGAHPAAPRASAQRKSAPAPSAPPLLARSAADKKADRASARANKSMAEKIAPKKRAPGPPAELVPPAPEKPSNYRKRELPKGRGRFAVVAGNKLSISELGRAAARDELKQLVEQSGTRIALKKRLTNGWVGPRGKVLSVEDLEVVVGKQKLTDLMEALERDAVLSALTQSRGARGRAAQSLGMSVAEFERLTEQVGATREAEEIRDRYAREALSSRHLSLRLDLIERSQYLADLGIVRRFREALERDLSAMLDRALEGATTTHALALVVARREGLKADLVERAMDRLGLSARYRQRLA